MENENLIDALGRIKESNAEQDRMWFLYNLVNAKLVLPVSVDVIPDENGNIPSNASVKYFSIKNTDGKIYLVTFTCVDYFNEWQKSIHKYHVRYDYDQIEKMVTREGSGFDGFIIDPLNSNVIMSNDVLKNITRTLPSDMSVKAERIITENGIGLQPVKNPPKKLISALKDYMANDNSIKSAHIMQTLRKGEKIPTLILVVDFLGSAQRVFDSLSRVAQNNMDTNQPIGMMAAYDKVAAKFTENVEPFYKK